MGLKAAFISIFPDVSYTGVLFLLAKKGNGLYNSKRNSAQQRSHGETKVNYTCSEFSEYAKGPSVTGPRPGRLRHVASYICHEIADFVVFSRSVA
jgi:hypothetical protein